MIAPWLILAAAAGAVVLRGLIVWEGDRGRLIVGDRGSLAILTAGGLGALYFIGLGLGGVGSSTGGSSGGGFVYGAPNTPTIGATMFAPSGDSVRLSGTVFVGSGDAVHDSTQFQVDTVTGDWSSPVFSSSLAAVRTDTATGLDSAAHLKARVRYKADPDKGGWSAWSDSVDFVMVLSNPSVFDDFSTYTSVTNFSSDPRGIYDEGEHFCDSTCTNAGDGNLVLDTGVGYGASDRSMRMDWDRYGSAGAGGTISISPSLTGSTTKVWVEAIATIESGFQIDNGFGGGVAWKWLFINQTGAGSGRYALEWTGQNGTLDFYPPDAEWGGSEEYHLNLPYSFESFNDGLPHSYRMFVDLAADSMCAQIDEGTVYCNGAGDGYNATATELSNVALSRNINQRLQTGDPHQVWWHQWSVWYDGNDPEWW